MKRLQAEWKTLGPVRRNKSEVVWNRFRAAADRFFTRFHNRHEITLATKLAEREVLVVELERLAEADPGSEPDLAERVQQLRTTWNRSVPIPVAEFKALTDRWHAALTRTVAVAPQAFAGTDLDPAIVIQRMEKLVGRVEAFLEEMDDSTEGLSHTELLAAKLRSALATNAMGGRVNEDAKWRAATDAVKDAQAAWQRLPPTKDPAVEGLSARFREACRRINEAAARGRQQSAGAGDRRAASRDAGAAAAAVERIQIVPLPSGHVMRLRSPDVVLRHDRRFSGPKHPSKFPPNTSAWTSALTPSSVSTARCSSKIALLPSAWEEGRVGPEEQSRRTGHVEGSREDVSKRQSRERA